MDRQCYPFEEESCHVAVSRDQGDSSYYIPHQFASTFLGLILITMENYSDSNTSSESEYESGQESLPESDGDEDEPTEP